MQLVHQKDPHCWGLKFENPNDLMQFEPCLTPSLGAFATRLELWCGDVVEKLGHGVESCIKTKYVWSHSVLGALFGRKQSAAGGLQLSLSMLTRYMS